MKTEINPPVKSKINGTAIASVVSAAVVVFALDLSAEAQAQIVAGILAISQAAVFIFRTFYTEPQT